MLTCVFTPSPLITFVYCFRKLVTRYSDGERYPRAYRRPAVNRRRFIH